MLSNGKNPNRSHYLALQKKEKKATVKSRIISFALYTKKFGGAVKNQELTVLFAVNYYTIVLRRVSLT